MHQIDSAEHLINEALSMVTLDENPKEYATAKSALASIHELKGDLRESIKLFRESAPIFLELQDSFKFGVTMNNLGIAFELQANYTAALESYFIASDIFEDLGVKRGVAAVNRNMGMIKQKQKSFDESLVLYKKALIISKEIGNKRSEGGNLNAVGAIYMDMNQLDSAAFYLEESALVRTDINDEHGISESYNNLGKLYRLKDDCEKGIKYNTKSLEYALKAKSTKAHIFSLLELGFCYDDLSNFAKAKYYLNNALELANNMGEVSLMYKIENALYNLYKERNSKKALIHFENAITFRDSMFNKSKTEELKSIELNYEFDKERIISAQKLKNLEIEDELKSTRLKNKNYTIFLLITLIGGALLLSLLVWKNYKKNQAISYQEKELQKQKITQLEKEKKILAMNAMLEGQEAERMRIAKDLHDGLGGLLSTVKARLTNINTEVKKIESYNIYKKTTSMVDEACDEVRRISHNLLPGALRLDGLKTAVEQLGDDLQEAHSFSVNVEVLGFDDKLDETKEIFLYRIIQESMNNIIKYANAKAVLIQLSETNNEYHLIVEDNGIGFDQDKDDGGIGLKSISSRVEHLQGKLDISSILGKGTTISIHIPKASHAINDENPDCR